MTTTTTITSTTLSNPTLNRVNPNKTQVLESSGKEITLILIGTNFAEGASVKLTKAGQSDIIGTVNSVSSDGTTINAKFTLPAKTQEGTIGYWAAVVTNPNSQSATLPHAFATSYAGVFFYPNQLSFHGLQSSATTSAARIVYNLSADTPIEVVIYDIREMKIVYRRKYASGQTGGSSGYNEIQWNGQTDFGHTIANGTYVLQIYSSRGEIIGQTYFVVKD